MKKMLPGAEEPGGGGGGGAACLPFLSSINETNLCLGLAVGSFFLFPPPAPLCLQHMVFPIAVQQANSVGLPAAACCFDKVSVRGGERQVTSEWTSFPARTRPRLCLDCLSDLFSRRVSHSLVFLFILLSTVSGGEALINGNSESNLPVIH